MANTLSFCRHHHLAQVFCRGGNKRENSSPALCDILQRFDILDEGLIK